MRRDEVEDEGWYRGGDDWGSRDRDEKTLRVPLNLLIKLVLAARNSSDYDAGTNFTQIKLSVADEGKYDRNWTHSPLSQNTFRFKELLIIAFILSIWLYSLFRFWQVWRDILNFSAESLNRSQNGMSGVDSFWTWAVSAIRSLKKSRIPHGVRQKQDPVLAPMCQIFLFIPS
ncbi:uncharacterized protein LOC111711447 [Eurytemora carolleeae]|uniref:uncharacterized protein LOC111711447 n=1 Tax=Eurytemora carolleeae TaxID=1294199 RepID=UPI000C773B39|nr:uncharacterized protein LOC111711447 [Eurytemora carolleeae]|eukprot:XP_023341584.1 uncharacterized protein LOC111711447 [Eurytemora affinis]